MHLCGTKFPLRTSFQAAFTLIESMMGVMVTGCDSLQFWIYQHTPRSNSFDCYDPAYVTNARLVQVTWTCSRQMLGVKANTELVESAKIALRNR